MITFMVLFVLETLLLELILYRRLFWRCRKLVAGALIVVLPAACGLLVATQLNIYTVSFALVTVVRIFNLLRLIEGRNTEQYLRHSALRTSAYIGLAQLVSAALVLANPHPTVWHVLPILAVIQTLVALVLLFSTIRALRKSRPTPSTQHFSDAELPTVSVLIPARNETKDLEACLHSLISSNYPKLEIIVLDDCSRDRTPEIIKGFAHDGVRFISGAEPDANWLPKNAAYQKLAEAATGELLLFCGVDTRFGRSTIRTLVGTMITKNRQMISVMPKRNSGGIHAAVIQPMRYWWELALPRRYFNRPPVLSTCWIIAHDTFKSLGGFASSKRAIVPEIIFARQLIRTDDYSFIRAQVDFELATDKSWREQLDTAIRVRYPQVHRRPELAFLMVALELIFLLGPFVGLVVGLAVASAVITFFSACAVVLLIMTHVIIVTVSDPGNAPISLINFPLVVLMEIIVGITSMSKYEFSVVEWKGRNVCIPVMQVIPRLPKY